MSQSQSTVELRLTIHLELTDPEKVGGMSDADLCAYLRAELQKKLDGGITLRDRVARNGALESLQFDIGREKW